MKITEISLTNFRSFQATQNIHIAPVTLLFGPNSVGKSSVLMSLCYLQQVIQGNQCDPMYIEVMGDKYVGGFRKLVNGRDLNKKIAIKITALADSNFESEYSQVCNLLGDNFDLPIGNFKDRVKRVAIELKVAWSKQENTAYVSDYKVWMDDALIAEVISDEELAPAINYINFEHPMLADNDRSGIERANIKEYGWKKLRALVSGNPPIADEYTSSGSVVNDHDLTQNPLSLKNSLGALPHIGRLLETDIDAGFPAISRRVNEILTEVIVAPLDELSALLNRSLSIGPLRIVPDSRYKKNPYPKQKDWYSGAAAWDLLGRSSTQIDKLNFFLNDETCLNIDYSLRMKSTIGDVYYSGGSDFFEQLKNFKRMSKKYSSSAQVTFSEEDIDEVPDAKKNPLSPELMEKFLDDLVPDEPEAAKGPDVQVDAVLWDEKNKLEVAPSDIGIGISQLMPLVVAAVEGDNAIISCEQPELHVHPRIQVNVGDLLSQNSDKNTFLIETHSEHLILRLLRRIEETTENELPEYLKGVSPSDISIMYLEKKAGGVRAKRIEVDSSGEIMNRWPDGFFTERGEELF